MKVSAVILAVTIVIAFGKREREHKKTAAFYAAAIPYSAYQAISPIFFSLALMAPGVRLWRVAIWAIVMP